MKHLVDQLPFQDKIIDAPPRRLEMGSVAIPENVELTLIGGLHDLRFSNIDYLDDLFATSDIVVGEYFGWTDRTLKRVSSVAKGSSRSLQEAIAIERRLGETNRSAYDTNAGQAHWDIAFYNKLFASRKERPTSLRVLICDYPESHPAVRLKQYDSALGRFSRAVLTGAEIDEKTLEAKARRDVYIGQKLCMSIAELRKSDPSIKGKDLLKVVMPYGTMHYAIAEALDMAAQAADVATFSSATLFEPLKKHDNDFSDAEFEKVKQGAETGITAYQNWLRSPASVSGQQL